MYQERQIGQMELHNKPQNAETHLKDSVCHLLYELMKTSEWKIAQMIISELKMLQTSLEEIAKDLLLAYYY